MVVAGTSTGIPAFTAACLAGFCPNPAWITHPIYTSSTCSGCTPARFNASFTTIVPRSGAGIELNIPPIVPIAVRHAPANTTFLAIILSSLYVEFLINTILLLLYSTFSQKKNARYSPIHEFNSSYNSTFKRYNHCTLIILFITLYALPQTKTDHSQPYSL